MLTIVAVIAGGKRRERIAITWPLSETVGKKEKERLQESKQLKHKTDESSMIGGRKVTLLLGERLEINLGVLPQSVGQIHPTGRLILIIVVTTNGVIGGVHLMRRRKSIAANGVMVLTRRVVMVVDTSKGMEQTLIMLGM
jgi:hypothetical protein